MLSLPPAPALALNQPQTKEYLYKILWHYLLFLCGKQYPKPDIYGFCPAALTENSSFPFYGEFDVTQVND
jgi:hypothetical protein